jgi:hypothetical protein
MDWGAWASSPSASRISATRFERLASATNVPGQRRSGLGQDFRAIKHEHRQQFERFGREVNLAVFLRELSGVQIEDERAEANLQNDPLGRNLRSPWKSPETLAGSPNHTPPMKQLLVFVSLATLLSACHNGRPPSSPTAPSLPAAPPPTYSVSGVVFEITPSGRVPIEGVRVYEEPCDALYLRCDGDVAQFATTDTNGFYRFSVSGGQIHFFWASKNGYRHDEQAAPTCAGCFRSLAIDADTRLDMELVRQ